MRAISSRRSPITRPLHGLRVCAPCLDLGRATDHVTLDIANATGGYAWTSAFQHAQSLVSQMTLEEKITLITGQPGRCVGMTGAVERLGVPALCLEDGPAGVRPVQGISQFPAGQAVAATWDRDLMYARGYAMGKEFFDQ